MSDYAVGVFVAPYPFSYALGLQPEGAARYALDELARLFKSQTAPEETACVVVEPVLGEGGYVVPPAGFLAELHAFCQQKGVLLIADEIQTGFGRTGTLFAFEHEQVIPDVLVMAKGLASELPLSGVVTRPDLAARWTPVRMAARMAETRLPAPRPSPRFRPSRKKDWWQTRRAWAAC